MKLYFAYGANLHLDNMRWRCPDAVAIQPFHLEDYRLAFSGVATILPEQHSRVPGALWAISEADERALDQFEGWPYLYRKETIVQDGLEFMVYIMNSTIAGEPSKGYLDTIAAGYQDWGLALADLNAAVERTFWEIEYDMHSSATCGIGLGTHMEQLVGGQSGHDLRWLRDNGLADRDLTTVQ